MISIVLYSVVFYRYYTKRKLTKSMDLRDRARSDLYLAQLRSQSAPNTPGFGPGGPKSPAFSQYALSPRFPPSQFKSLSDISESPVAGPAPFTPAAGNSNNIVEPVSAFAQQNQPIAATTTAEGASSKPFVLQKPPTKAPSATPKLGQAAFRTPPASATAPTFHEPAPLAPGEQQYDAVPIPGAYADAAVKSPPPAQLNFR